MEYEFSYPIKIDHIDRKGTCESIAADDDALLALAGRLNVDSVESLLAAVTIVMQGDKTTYNVKGTVNGTVVQSSVISGDAVKTTITQDIDAWFTDSARVASFAREKQKRDSAIEDDEHEIRDEKDDPETIDGDAIDIGEVAVQFFALGINDYPRTESEIEGSGDYIEVSEQDAKPNPFAKLAALKVEE
jgi:uncharacterized metal-binding protein YceD (DUF177 family)